MNDVVELNYGAYSDTGRIRIHNEDTFLARPDLGLWLVADGMGGHAGGGVASKLAAQSIGSRVEEGLDLKDAIVMAHRDLLEAIERGDGEAGMGTTVVAIKVYGTRYEIAWLGDSRAYLWHDGRLRRLTHDHSYVQELLDNDAISESEALNHPERCTLSRSLGVSADGRVEVDVITGNLYAGERIILCTDGVSGELDDADIEQAMIEWVNESSECIAELLVTKAVTAGGNDNATAVVLGAPDSAMPRFDRTAPRMAVDMNPAPKQKRVMPVALLILMLVVAISVFIALFTHFKERPANENVLSMNSEQSYVT